jgi:hypothetical protein
MHQYAKLEDLRRRFEVVQGLLANFPKRTALLGRLKTVCPGIAYAGEMHA